MIFMGPFRYRQNLEGLRAFLEHVYPHVRSAVAECSLLVLGGDGAPAAAAVDPLFAQAGVRVLEHREDAEALLRDSAVSINPLVGIRGSAIKLLESLLAGRVCVSTRDGSRGFAASGPTALYIADDVPSMAAPLIDLLQHVDRRHALETPSSTALAEFTWRSSAARQAALYRSLMGAA